MGEQKQGITMDALINRIDKTMHVLKDWVYKLEEACIALSAENAKLKEQVSAKKEEETPEG